MCGIAGIRSFSPDDPIRADQIVQLLLAAEHRGKDACGLALQGRYDGKICVYKDDSCATRFVQSKGFESFLGEHLTPDVSTAILHTRAATSSGWGDGGTPRKQANNHPMWKGCTAVVHNGVISNHKWLFDELKLERSCDTDSDIIRAILDAKGIEEDGVKMLKRCSGGAAIAAVSERSPGKLLLGRSGGPLVVGSLKDQIVFGSERQIVHAGFRQHRKMWGVWMRPLHVDAAFTIFPTDTAWLFDDKGFSRHWPLSIAGFAQGYSYRFQQRELRAEARKKKVVVTAPLDGKEVVLPNYKCKNPACDGVWGITREQLQKHGLGNLYCAKCGWWMDGHKPIYEEEKK